MSMIFFVYSNSEIETEELISVLSSKFKIRNLGQVQQFLGRVESKKRWLYPAWKPSIWQLQRLAKSQYT